MKLYKQHKIFWLNTDNGWWTYNTTDGVDRAHKWCWYGMCGDPTPNGKAYPDLCPSTPFEFLVLTGKDIHNTKMITCTGTDKTYRFEAIKLNNN
jgi:hypothetical protein